MPSPVTALRRTDVKQEIDRPTGSTLLRYVGSRITFADEMYGYPDGTFFAAALDEVPVPPELAVASDRCGVDVTTLSSVAEARQAVLDVLLAEALVNAPELLSDLTTNRVYWQDWELRELERKHNIAVSRLVRLVKLAEEEIAVRGRPVRFDPGPLPYALIPPPAPLFPDDVPTRDDLPLPRPPLDPAPEPAPLSEETPVDPDGYDEIEPEDAPADVSEPVSSQVAERVVAAVRAAREAELAQRLPSGVRRRIRHFERGAYVAQGDTLDPRTDLAHAMADAQGMSKRRGEAAVIDWDGEWPVVVRRYGPNGCTVYKVEDALKRAGVADV